MNSLTQTASEVLSSTESTVQKALNVLSNKYAKSLVIVTLLAYVPFAAPKLPPSIVHIMGNYAVKFVYLFLLAYLLSNSVKVATVTALTITLVAVVLKKLQLEAFAGENVDDKCGAVMNVKNLQIDNDSNDPMITVRRTGETVTVPPTENDVSIGKPSRTCNAGSALHLDTLHPGHVVVSKEDVTSPTDAQKCGGEVIGNATYTGYDEFVEGQDDNYARV
jgi:hypothetical protein